MKELLFILLLLLVFTLLFTNCKNEFEDYTKLRDLIKPFFIKKIEIQDGSDDKNDNDEDEKTQHERDLENRKAYLYSVKSRRTGVSVL